MKIVTWQRATREGAKPVAEATARISRLEGMEGHARTADIRLRKYFPDENFDLTAEEGNGDGSALLMLKAASPASPGPVPALAGARRWCWHGGRKGRGRGPPGRCAGYLAGRGRGRAALRPMWRPRRLASDDRGYRGEPFGPPDILSCRGHQHPRTGRRRHAGGLGRHHQTSTCRAVLPQRRPGARDAEKGWGRIVNFASLQTHRAFPGGIAYGASKGGVGATDPRHGRGLVARRHHRQRHRPGFLPDRTDSGRSSPIPSAPRAMPRRPASAATASWRISTARFLFLCSEASATSPARC
jgi:hypothetical protein